jgi:hypothetical protein
MGSDQKLRSENLVEHIEAVIVLNKSSPISFESLRGLLRLSKIDFDNAIVIFRRDRELKTLKLNNYWNASRAETILTDDITITSFWADELLMPPLAISVVTSEQLLIVSTSYAAVGTSPVVRILFVKTCIEAINAFKCEFLVFLPEITIYNRASALEQVALYPELVHRGSSDTSTACDELLRKLELSIDKFGQAHI